MPDFPVDEFAGSDSQRLAAACTAALKAIPSSVILPDRELRLTLPNQKVRPGVSVFESGPNSGLFLDFPGASLPSGSAPAGLIVQGSPTLTTEGSVLSGFSVKGRDTGYYRLLVADQAVNTTFSDLVWGVCGQSFLELRNATEVDVVRCQGLFGGGNSYDRGSSKYKIAVVGCRDVVMNGLELGSAFHDHNQSFVTVNSSEDVTVADSFFYGSRTYCLNTHGAGSRNIVFTRNHLQPGPSAWYGAVLVGNEAWGADTDVYICDNTMIGDGRFLQVRAGSEVFMSGNKVPRCNELIGFGPGGGTVQVKP